MFSLIDANDPEYEGTSNSLHHPVLVVNKKELLENHFFHIKVDNFIGSSIKEIFGKIMFCYEFLDFVWNVLQIILFLNKSSILTLHAIYFVFFKFMIFCYFLKYKSNASHIKV